MGRPIHFEVGVKDPDRAAQFYSKVFDWKTEKWGGDFPYWLITTGEKETPGIDGAFEVRDDGEPGTVNVIDVADLDGTLAKIEASGGKIVSPKRPVPGVGWVAYGLDTEGNRFGMMQTDPAAS
jgi:predicted enzyme related to lactoylglutathione lyase